MGLHDLPKELGLVGKTLEILWIVEEDPAVPAALKDLEGEVFSQDSKQWQVLEVRWDSESTTFVCLYFDLSKHTHETADEAECEFSSADEVKQWVTKSKGGTRNEIQVGVIAAIEPMPMPKKLNIWWRCNLLAPTGELHELTDDGNTEAPPEKLPVYRVHYEAKPPSFPEEEEREIVFISPHTVYDIAEDDMLCWRDEGTGWEPSAAEAEEGVNWTSGARTATPVAAPATGDHTVGTSPKQVIDAVMAGIFDKNSSRFKMLPMAQQLSIATVMRAAADKLSTALDEEQVQKHQQGQPQVFTPADVHQVLSRIGPALVELRNTIGQMVSAAPTE
jgi:hypothetical protein